MKRLLVTASLFALGLSSTSTAQPASPRDDRGRPPSAAVTLPARVRPDVRPPTTVRPPPPPRPGGGGYGPYRPGGGHFIYGGVSRSRYYAPHYRYPPGYAYRRWHRGQHLPLLFLTSAYYFDDYRMLGIRMAPAGYRWVRFGPDLLLVDRLTGRISDVIHSAFY